MSRILPLPPLIFAEVLDCVMTRIRWYETRGYDLPERVKLTANYLADCAGVDVQELETMLIRLSPK